MMNVDFELDAQGRMVNSRGELIDQYGRLLAPRAKPVVLTPEQVEAARAEKFDAARRTFRAAESAIAESRKLTAKEQEIQQQRDAAVDACEDVCAPLRREVQELEGLGRLTDRQEERRAAIYKDIRIHTQKLYEATSECDQLLRPITARQEELGKAIGLRQTSLGDMYESAPHAYRQRLYVATQSWRWSNARHDTAKKDASPFAAAELDDAQQELAAARADLAAAQQAIEELAGK